MTHSNIKIDERVDFASVLHKRAGSHLTISSMAGSVFVQLQNRAKRDESSRDRDLEFYGYALCYGIMPLLCHTHAYN
eukprot:scaffold4377_cov88-Skeletonema_marinoi.AAC.1